MHDPSRPIRLVGPAQRAHAKAQIDAARLRELLVYEPDTGLFRWRARRRGYKVGAIAGSRQNRGYWKIRVDGSDYLAHRLAWLYEHGSWPVDQIDHINGVRDDNRLSNLRAATIAENNQNAALRSDNCSGFTGVGFHRRAGKFRARIVPPGGKEVHLGLYETAEEAHAAYLAARAGLHPFQPVPREIGAAK